MATAKQMSFFIIQCRHGIGSASNCDGNGLDWKKIGIIVTGGGVHSVMATANIKGCRCHHNVNKP